MIIEYLAIYFVVGGLIAILADVTMIEEGDISERDATIIFRAVVVTVWPVVLIFQAYDKVSGNDE